LARLMHQKRVLRASSLKTEQNPQFAPPARTS
jgi:hypothetical protein